MSPIALIFCFLCLCMHRYYNIIACLNKNLLADMLLRWSWRFRVLKWSHEACNLGLYVGSIYGTNNKLWMLASCFIVHKQRTLWDFFHSFSPFLLLVLCLLLHNFSLRASLYICDANIPSEIISKRYSAEHNYLCVLSSNEALTHWTLSQKSLHLNYTDVFSYATENRPRLHHTNQLVADIS